MGMLLILSSDEGCLYRKKQLDFLTSYTLIMYLL